MASFDEQDRNFPEIEISKNHSTNSLFRELEYDLHEAQQQLKAIQQQSYWFRTSSFGQRVKERMRLLVSRLRKIVSPGLTVAGWFIAVVKSQGDAS